MVKRPKKRQKKKSGGGGGGGGGVGRGMIKVSSKKPTLKIDPKGPTCKKRLAESVIYLIIASGGG
jgi:hypothetical protein